MSWVRCAGQSKTVRWDHRQDNLPGPHKTYFFGSICRVCILAMLDNDGMVRLETKVHRGRSGYEGRGGRGGRQDSGTWVDWDKAMLCAPP